jgi:SRSO17 transposase
MNTMSVEEIAALHIVLKSVWTDHSLKHDYRDWWKDNLDTILTAYIATSRIVRDNQIEIEVTA